MMRTTALVCLLLVMAFTVHAQGELPIDFSPGLPPLEGGYQGEMAYQDPSIQVAITSGKEYATDYWVARITIAHPSQLRTVSAAGFDSSRVMNGRALANRVQAVFALNGDYFSYINDGYLIRQGELYRDLPGGRRDVLLIDDRGDFYIALRADQEVIAPYREMDIVNSFNFGPALVVGGERVEKYWDNNNAANKGRQRMGIAQVKAGTLEYVVIATAGPSARQPGMTLDQFSRLFAKEGVENAYNLDGGDSTMMMFREHYINADHAATMRAISDIIYFATTSTSLAD